MVMIFSFMPIGAPGIPTLEAGPIDALASDEGRASCGTGLLAVRVGEDHPLVGEAIDVRRLIAHKPARVAAQSGDADVITPDDEDVRLVRFGHFILPLLNKGFFDDCFLRDDARDLMRLLGGGPGQVRAAVIFVGLFPVQGARHPRR
jgi:hypothetical protein